MTGVLLVTGGGRGIGAATAKMAAARRWRVCLSYERNASAAEEVVQAISGSGGQAIAMQADVGAEQDVAALFDDAEAAFCPITGLVNNAGIAGRLGAFADAA